MSGGAGRQKPFAAIAAPFKGPGRLSAYALATAALFFVVAAALYPFERAAAAEANYLRAKAAEFAELSAEYARLTGPSAGPAASVFVARPAGAAATVEAAAGSIGIGRKLKSIKGAGERTLAGGGKAETVEARFERLSFNELVNLLHALEGAGPHAAITAAAVKKSFDSPELMDLAVSIEVRAGAK